MFFSDEVLSHRHHLDQRRWMLNGVEANDRYFLCEAAEMHALSVIDCVSGLRGRAVVEGQASVKEVHDHLVYGVARRTGDIWLAMRELIAKSPVDRTKSLSTEETSSLSMALNSIYINIRGTLDNLAWAVIEDAGGLAKVRLPPKDVDLFGRQFSRVETWEMLTTALADIAPWSAELAKLRNPAAHRIPLAVISSELNDAEAAEYQRLCAEMLAPLPDGSLNHEVIVERAKRQQAIKAEIKALGRYRPMFAHMPSDGAMPIYPTVAEDVGKLVRSGRIVLDYLAARRAPS